MSRIRHLRNAPITEALVEVRVKARPELSSDDLRRAAALVSTTFPQVLELRGFEAVIEFKHPGQVPPSISTKGEPHGLLLKSQDGRSIAQFRIDAFVFNRLQPYTSWDEILPHVEQLWAIYLQVARPESVTRIAVRYINHIPVRHGIDSLDSILRTAPVLPPEIPAKVSGLVSRVTVTEPDNGPSAHIVQALAATSEGASPALLLDIDAFIDVALEPSTAEVFSTLGRLRDLKNRVFFSCLTDETIERFE